MSLGGVILRRGLLREGLPASSFEGVSICMCILASFQLNLGSLVQLAAVVVHYVSLCTVLYCIDGDAIDSRSHRETSKDTT